VRLDSKVALVTGSGMGIGRASALAMASEGAKIVIAEINAAAGEETAHLVTKSGGEAIAVKADVTDEDSVKAAITAAVRHFGALHVLHNNAGGSTPADGTVLQAPIDEFWRAIRLDLFGTFLGCKHGIPAIADSGGGSIINMSSIARLKGGVGVCYSSAKGGVAALTRAVAFHHAAQGVRVNAIAPGVTMTDRVRARFEGGVPRIMRLAEQHIVGMIEPDDIANMVVFLASDASRKITGQVYAVDSGTTIC
jgi:NAD(P)-dependent dehydrogenase (short-subunit alcohol dehydrogenase family)